MPTETNGSVASTSNDASQVTGTSNGAPAENKTEAVGIAGQTLSAPRAQAESAQPEADERATNERENTSDLEKTLASIASKIDAAASRVEQAAQALIAPAQGQQQKTDFQERVSTEVQRGDLHTKRRKDGAVEYSLPFGDVRVAGYTLSGKRDAFVDHEKHLEVVGASDVHMKAAMEHAKRKWVGDDIIIHAKGEHLDRAIKFAVASGLNIVNADHNVQAKVAVERERQQAPERAAVVPVIQRVSRSA